jgi:broad specificity phosphatase PhoE
MREKEPTTRIIFVRHGQTDFPKDRIYCDGREDPVLNAKGLVQAQAAAKLLESQPVDAIYTSPSSRTRMTAEAINEVVKAPLVEVDELRERRFGIWDGLFFEEIARDYPEEFQAWRRDMVHYTPRGGETITALQDRAVAAVKNVIRDHKAKLVVIVSHVGPIRVCLTHAMNIPLENYRQLRIDYGALSGVDYGTAQNNLIFSNVLSPFKY